MLVSVPLEPSSSLDAEEDYSRSEGMPLSQGVSQVLEEAGNGSSGSSLSKRAENMPKHGRATRAQAYLFQMRGAWILLR